MSAGGGYFTPRPQAEPASPPVDAATCSHPITRKADWPRWRTCDGCGQTVHRIETDDYRQLVADGRLALPPALAKKDKP